MDDNRKLMAKPVAEWRGGVGRERFEVVVGFEHSVRDAWRAGLRERRAFEGRFYPGAIETFGFGSEAEARAFVAGLEHMASPALPAHVLAFRVVCDPVRGRERGMQRRKLAS